MGVWAIRSKEMHWHLRGIVKELVEIYQLFYGGPSTFSASVGCSPLEINDELFPAKVVVRW